MQYWSDTHSRWIYGTVRTVHDNGVLDLDEKHGLDPSEVLGRSRGWEFKAVANSLQTLYIQNRGISENPRNSC